MQGEEVMSEAKPCEHQFQAAPKASEAPVEEKCATCGREEAWHHGSMHGFRKPAPAPEPKQGSEEPIEPVTELEAEKSTSKILRAQLTQALAERDEAKATKDMHKERQEDAWAEVAALRAQLAAAQVEIKPLKFEKEAFREAHAEKDRALAAAREEIAKLTNEVMQHAINMVKGAEVLTAEKARADRAEERVKELEEMIVAKSEGDSMDAFRHASRGGRDTKRRTKHSKPKPSASSPPAPAKREGADEPRRR